MSGVVLVGAAGAWLSFCLFFVFALLVRSFLCHFSPRSNILHMGKTQIRREIVVRIVVFKSPRILKALLLKLLGIEDKR